MKGPCTRALHSTITATAASFALYLVNHRRWSGADLEIAECPICGSTLSREVDPAPFLPTPAEH